MDILEDLCSGFLQKFVTQQILVETGQKYVTGVSINIYLCD
jgi:hypothetical protein